MGTELYVMMQQSSFVLPEPLEPLRDLAYNLRWSWHAPTLELFAELDPVLWTSTRHNPARLLAEIEPVRLEAAARSARYLELMQREHEGLKAYLASNDTWFARHQGRVDDMQVAYFCAEFAITECLRIFSGGLGVLAGDHLKSASDLGIPLVAVGLFYKEGYFTQRVDAAGKQIDAYEFIDPRHMPLTLVKRRGERVLVRIPFLDHKLYAQVWRADVGRVPLYLLDTDVPENRSEDRHITDRLYGGNNEHRLRQEITLGIGGMRALAALGINPTVIHLNEGHASFAAVERVRQITHDKAGVFASAAERLTGGVVFTTHTPVPAGHDFFPAAMLEQYLGGYVWEMREPWKRFLSLGRHDPKDEDEPFNMTLLALRMAARRNGVSELHGEVSRKMWRGVWNDIPEEDVPIGHVTNGVHLSTWVAPKMQQLLSAAIGPEWDSTLDPAIWSNISKLKTQDLWAVRKEMRSTLVDVVRNHIRAQNTRRRIAHDWVADALDPDALTIVFARRFATYKRATLLLSDPDRLLRMLATGNVQFVFAGKAHPRDEPGQEFLRKIVEFAALPEARKHFVFLEGYDVELARYLTSGADVWLNVPRRPYEASGTSGMKAAANGALNLSILDGWWAEAWREHNRLPHPPGWAIDVHANDSAAQDAADALELFRMLEDDVLPMFARRNQAGIPLEWCERIRSSLRQVVPFFNTHRMVAEYTTRFYGPAHQHSTHVAHGIGDER